MATIILLSTYCCSGQNPYYLKAVIDTPYIEGYMGMTVKDSSFVIHGVKVMNGLSRRYFVKTNYAGDTLLTKQYYRDSLAEFNAGVDRPIIKSPDGYFLSGTDWLSPGYYEPILKRINYLGDTLWSVNYSTDSLDTEFVGIVRGGDSIVTCFGTKVVDTNYTIKPLGVSFDLAGNKLWESTYNVGVGGMGVSMISTNDNGYILAGRAGSTPTYSYVLKLDSLGNVEWLKNYTHPGNEAGFINNIGQNNAILYGGTDRGNGREGYAILLDENGDSLWSFYHKYLPGSIFEGFDSGIETQDGGISFVGNTYEIGTGNNLIKLVKVSGSGEFLWDRLYQIRNADHYPIGIRKTNSGALVIFGYVFPDAGLTQDGFIGHFSCLGYTELPAADFNWYNLGGNQINLENTGGYADEYLWDFGDGWTYYHESDPQQIGSDEPFVSHTYQNPGTYTVTLYAIACQDTSVSTQTITVDPLGVEELAGQSSLSVYPNPARDVITIEAATPSAGQARLVLHTTSGRQIKEVVLQQTVSKTQINVADLPAGMYLLRIEGLSGVEAVQRVVVR